VKGCSRVPSSSSSSVVVLEEEDETTKMVLVLVRLEAGGAGVGQP
jgi:hypothetical protein